MIRFARYRSEEIGRHTGATQVLTSIWRGSSVLLMLCTVDVLSSLVQRKEWLGLSSNLPDEFLLVVVQRYQCSRLGQVQRHFE
jgi:hypothetical protein